MNALQWITKEAKRLKRKYPHRYDHLQNGWRDGYVAQASAVYARKHKGKSPVGKPKKKKIGAAKKRQKPMHKKPRKKTSAIGAINRHIKVAREGLEKKLSEKMLDQYKAPTKTKRRKIAKDIAKLKQQIRRLK